MTDKERIERLERVLTLLISWLHLQLGTAAANILLKELTEEPKP